MLIIFDNHLERNFIMTIELIKQLLDACYLAKRACCYNHRVIYAKAMR